MRNAIQPEQLDVLDEFGNRTSRTVARGTPLQPGEFHLAVHIWLRSNSGVYLIQQRALHLASAPGMWATMVGYVLAGEGSLPAAIRETQEELGLMLAANDLRFFKGSQPERSFKMCGWGRSPTSRVPRL